MKVEVQPERWANLHDPKKTEIRWRCGGVWGGDIPFACVHRTKEEAEACPRRPEDIILNG